MWSEIALFWKGNKALGHQTEEEIGSAEEQPISNRFDE
jgi:hypothetical protein